MSRRRAFPEPESAPPLHDHNGHSQAAARCEDEIERLRAQVANLEVALHSNREIGAAVGIMMHVRSTSYDNAFALLVRASQRRNVPVHQIAAEVVERGELDDAPGAGRSSGERTPPPPA